MKIHVNKKLAEKLKKSGYIIGDGVEVKQSLLGDWNANITTIQRRQCLMFIHDQTRFCIALTGVIQKELKDLNFWFEDMLGNTMLKLGYPQTLIEKAVDSIGELSFDTQCSRSVQGTLRLAIGELDAYTWDGTCIMDLGTYSLSARLCDRPCTVKGIKGHIWPAKEMKRLLMKLPDATDQNLA